MSKFKFQEFVFSYSNNELSNLQIQQIYQFCAFRYKYCKINGFENKTFAIKINYFDKTDELNQLLFERIIKNIVKKMKDLKYENPKCINQ